MGWSLLLVVAGYNTTNIDVPPSDLVFQYNAASKPIRDWYHWNTAVPLGLNRLARCCLIDDAHRLPPDVNRNVVHPTVFCNPNIDKDVSNGAVEIIELNSDISENDSWCNTNGTYQEQQDDYKVNTTARDKRREISRKNDNNNNDDQKDFNKFCTDFYGIDCYDKGDTISTVHNSQSEFITIINNHRTSVTSSDSSLYDDIQVIQYKRTNDHEYVISDNDSSDSRNISYDLDRSTEKQTIWIYALKNKRYMSEHDFELLNISSKESNSTTDVDEPSEDITNIRRIATPIPSHIPKINLLLSPTLPTVTEVAEPNKQASNNSEIGIKNADVTTHPQKPSNGWFKNDPQNDNQNLNKIETSPRKRRRLRLSARQERNELIEQETRIYCEPEIIIRNNEVSPSEKEIHENDYNEHHQVISRTFDNISPENKNDSESDESLYNLQKPQIKLSTKMKTHTIKDISDPIEKLDGNWIGQSLPEVPEDNELLEVYDYNVMDTVDNETQLVSTSSSKRTGGAMEESAGDRLFIRNMSLLKPAEWTQYLPLTGSVQSLHLSLSVDTDFNREEKSWFKRFILFVNCCK